MPSEKDIELYIRYPEQLSGAQIRRIEEALMQDDELALLADWYSRYYQIEDEPAGRTSDKPYAIELVPMGFREIRSRKTFVLAAQSGDQKQSRIESVKSFVSDRYRTLMRVLHDREKKMTRIHVVSDHVGDKDVVLLYIPEEDLHLVSRPGGKLEVPENQVDRKQVEDWSTCRILLPMLRARISRQYSGGDGYVAADTGGEIETIEIMQEDKTVTVISGRGDRHTEPGIMLVRSDEESTLWRMKNGRATIPAGIFKDRDVTLFMYHVF